MTGQKLPNGGQTAAGTRPLEAPGRLTPDAGLDACAGSRSIAAAIHDLRQPLQTMSLLQGVLAGRISGEEAAKLVESLALPLAAISDTLDRLSDIFKPDSAVLPAPCGFEEPSAPGMPQDTTILLIEDDPAVAETLDLILSDEGYQVTVAADGWQALELMRDTAAPDIVIADYNLPKSLNGLQTIITLRETFRQDIPGLILTGGVPSEALREIADLGCICLAKPARIAELTGAVGSLIRKTPSAPPDKLARPPAADDGGMQRLNVYVVDDDAAVRVAARDLLEGEGFRVETFADGPAFFEAFRPDFEGCVLVDALMPGMNGFEFIERLKAANDLIPAIMVTGAGDVPAAVRAMKAGAADFIEKPVSPADLVACIRSALKWTGDGNVPPAWGEASAARFAGLTARQRQIMTLIVNGQPNKTIAARLGLSQRTVENHRAAIMRKFGASSVAALIRMALTTA